MGLKFTREYEEIIEELAEGLLQIQNLYDYFDMDILEWSNYSKEEQKEFSKTLADDLFYGLGAEGKVEIVDGSVEHDGCSNQINIYYKNTICKEIKL